MSAPEIAAPMDVRLMNIAALMLGAAACVVSLGLAVRWALAQPMFAISKIVVEGDTSHHNAITLKANVGGRISGNFFTLDLAQARGVFEAVPWVRKATVRREFPNRLRVTLEEHRSSGFWGADSESRMVNHLGEVFEANAGDTEAEELPRFVGAEGASKEVLTMYQQLSKSFQPMDAVIEQLELTGRNGWRLQLDSGTQMELGRGSPAEVMARVDKFLATHKQVLASYQRSGLDRVESVDLRNGEGYAIRLSGVSTLAAAAVEKK
ncbi:cell division protein FtsQ/DivIB [Variovorax sp. PCZ-1]|nr:cell division protein FtsQ/DivIB [Variovorax sp. PCZ-1]